MDRNLSRKQLIELVERLISGECNGKETNALLRLLERNVVDPEVSNLIYWPNFRGYEDNLSAEQIVDIALSYEPILLGPATTPTDPA